MKMKPKTPYQRLLEDVQDFCRKVKFRHTLTMWVIPKAKLTTDWGLSGLWERTAAAEQLGYDVVLVADETGLIVKYVKKVPDIPFSWQ